MGEMKLSTTVLNCP